MYVGAIDHVETLSNGPNRHRVVIPSAADSSAGNASIEGLGLGAELLKPRHSSGSDLTNSDSYLPESEAVLDRDDYTAGSLVLARLDADLRMNGDATVYGLFTAVESGDPAAEYDVSAFHDDY